MRALPTCLAVLLVACGGPDLASKAKSGGQIIVGPGLRVFPTSIAFGPVTTATKTRTLVVRNIGSRPLFLEGVALAPHTDFTVTPKGFSGIPEIAPGKEVQLEVRFTPTKKGYQTTELTLFSNDRLDPQTKVLLSGDTTEPTPCKLRFDRTQVIFESVAADIPVTFTNTGGAAGDVCQVENIRIAPGASPIFSLKDGSIGARTLGPQESMTVVVRMAATPAPGMSTTHWGQLEVNLVGQLPQRVSITATLAASCITVTPTDLSFGTVQSDCSSPGRTFTVYNTCSKPVTVTSAAFSTPSSEFIFVDPASFHAGTAVPSSGATAFPLSYRPRNSGRDDIALLLTFDQSGQPAESTITLNGTGELREENTDTHLIEGPPRTLFHLTSVPVLSTLSVSIGAFPINPIAPSGATVWAYLPSENAVKFEPGFTPAQGSLVYLRYLIACIP